MPAAHSRFPGGCTEPAQAVVLVFFYTELADILSNEILVVKEILKLN
jgi:hypothetical protein